MRIDSHQHFWKFDPFRHIWIDSSMQNIAKDFLPEDLKPLLETNLMDGCIAVQADQSETETEFLLKLAEENSFIKGVDLIINTKGKIVCSGIGKSGLIARKVSATFSSVGIPSFFLSPF